MSCTRVPLRWCIQNRPSPPPHQSDCYRTPAIPPPPYWSPWLACMHLYAYYDRWWYSQLTSSFVKTTANSLKEYYIFSALFYLVLLLFLGSPLCPRRIQIYVEHTHISSISSATTLPPSNHLHSDRKTLDSRLFTIFLHWNNFRVVSNCSFASSFSLKQHKTISYPVRPPCHHLILTVPFAAASVTKQLRNMKRKGNNTTLQYY